MTTGVVTGMLAEARLLAGLDFRVVATGGDPIVTANRTEQLLRDGARRLVSFGIAGALDPRLRPGDLIVATGVVLPNGQTVLGDADWLQSVRRKLPEAIPGTIAGCSTAIATRADKAALHRRTGALAVDMESHHVASAAHGRGVPFMVLRAVADLAGDDLPPAALVGLDSEGRPAIWPVLRSLLSAPGQMPALIRAALRSRLALKALLRGRAGLL